MNYFYVRKTRTGDGWKVFWLDKNYLDSLTSNIVVDSIDYPSKKSKQITIKCHNSKQKYKVEIRNSKSGEYPNDIKFKVI
jgi:light-regulated signal transduction histidine kinase (bacteriophytochrome)